MKSKIKLLVVGVFVFATMFGVGINVSSGDGLSIRSDREVQAFDDGVWENNWTQCSAQVLVQMGANFIVQNVLGAQNNCKFAWSSSCSSISCTAIANPG